MMAGGASLAPKTVVVAGGRYGDMRSRSGIFIHGLDNGA